MKRTSLQDPGGFVYPCANYDTVLSNRNYLISMVCLSYFMLFMYFVFLRESFAIKLAAFTWWVLQVSRLPSQDDHSQLYLNFYHQKWTCFVNSQ